MRKTSGVKIKQIQENQRKIKLLNFANLEEQLKRRLKFAFHPSVLPYGEMGITSAI